MVFNLPRASWQEVSSTTTTPPWSKRRGGGAKKESWGEAEGGGERQRGRGASKPTNTWQPPSEVQLFIAITNMNKRHTVTMNKIAAAAQIGLH